jgi:GGDEF domain-containing protein
MGWGKNDDPRKLRDLLGKAATLASDHSLNSVVVGVAAPEGDLVFPEVVDFVDSALRVDDAVFRMTRDRAVFFLADVSRANAEAIVERLLADFRAHSCVSQLPALSLGFFEVSAGTQALAVKDVLPELFRDPEVATH